MNREEQEFQETLELLREAHRDPIPEAHYAAVRARVLSQLAAQRRPWGMWAYGVAAVAVLLAVVGRTPRSARGPLATLPVSTRQPRVPPSQPDLSVEGPARGPAADQGVRPTLAVSVGRRKRLPRERQRAASGVIGPPVVQPLVVKLITNDPNVVIYWISGE